MYIHKETFAWAACGSRVGYSCSRGSNKRLNVFLRCPIGEVMVGYLLYRCKHLCMLIFHVVPPSLTKTKYLNCLK